MSNVKSNVRRGRKRNTQFDRDIALLSTMTKLSGRQIAKRIADMYNTHVTHYTVYSRMQIFEHFRNYLELYFMHKLTEQEQQVLWDVINEVSDGMTTLARQDRRDRQSFKDYVKSLNLETRLVDIIRKHNVAMA